MTLPKNYGRQNIVFCWRFVVCSLVCLEHGICVKIFRILIIRFPSRMSGITDYQNMHLYVYDRKWSKVLPVNECLSNVWRFCLMFERFEDQFSVQRRASRDCNGCTYSFQRNVWTLLEPKRRPLPSITFTNHYLLICSPSDAVYSELLTTLLKQP